MQRRSVWSLVAWLCLTGVSGWAQEELPRPAEVALPSPRTDLPKVLVTGFAPFGPWGVNVSWEGARRLAGEVISGHEVIAVELPVEYGRVWRALPVLLERYRPAAVLHFGMNPALGDPPLLVERRGRNGRYYAPDAARRSLAPRCDAVVEGGAFWRTTTLPVRALVAAFAAEGLPAATSDNAGYYLCEFTLFSSLYLQETRGSDAPTGFIHVPRRWPVERAAQAMRLAVRVALAASPEGSGERPAPRIEDVPDDPFAVRGACDALRASPAGR